MRLRSGLIEDACRVASEASKEKAINMKRLLNLFFCPVVGRFCLDSIPMKNKEKVFLNIGDIVAKKRMSSTD